MPSALARKSSSTTFTRFIWARRPKRLVGDAGEYTCDALIVATGASPPAKYPGPAGAKRNSTAKACRPAPPATASSTKGQDVVVVGGGKHGRRRRRCTLSNIAKSHCRAPPATSSGEAILIDRLMAKTGRRQHARDLGSLRRRSAGATTQGHRRTAKSMKDGSTGQEVKALACSSPSATRRTAASSKASSTWGGFIKGEDRHRRQCDIHQHPRRVCRRRRG